MNATTRPSPPDPADREAARRLRVEVIVNGATVRAALGIAATYRRLDDGQHEVTLGGRTWTAATLPEAIDAAQSMEGGR